MVSGVRVAALSAAWLITVPGSAATSDGSTGEGQFDAREPGRFDFKPPEHEVRVAVSTGILLGLSSAEYGISDVATENLVGVLDTSVAVRFQLPSAWSGGLRASWGMGGNGLSERADRNLYQLSVEGRWQPEGELGPYAMLGAGGALMIDSLGGGSSWQWAPLVSAALGADVGSAGPIAFGAELRGAVTVFSPAGERFAAEGEWLSNTYGVVPWLGLNLVATLGI